MKLLKHLVMALLIMATQQAFAGKFDVKNPWVREAPPGAETMAAYLILENNKNAAVSFIGAKSEDFQSIEVHQTVIKNDMAAMIQRQNVNVLPYSSVRFEPGGLHLMLIGPKRDLYAGDKVKIVLNFGNYRRLKVVFPVRKSGDGAQQHNH